MTSEVTRSRRNRRGIGYTSHLSITNVHPPAGKRQLTLSRALSLSLAASAPETPKRVARGAIVTGQIDESCECAIKARLLDNYKPHLTLPYPTAGDDRPRSGLLLPVARCRDIVTMAADKELVSQLTTGGYIVNFITNTDRKGSANLTLEVLEQRKELLDTYWTSVEARHLSLSEREQALKEQAYFKDHLFLDYEEAFINAKAELMRRIRAIRPEPGARSSTSAALQISSQLPKIALPTFTGNQTDWDDGEIAANGSFKINVNFMQLVAKGSYQLFK